MLCHLRIVDNLCASGCVRLYCCDISVDLCLDTLADIHLEIVDFGCMEVAMNCTGDNEGAANCEGVMGLRLRSIL